MIPTKLAGEIAAAISLIAYIPFVIAILRGKAQPHRASWFIWSLVSAVIAISYVQTGATDTALVPAVYGVCSVIIFVFSIRYGVGGWTPFDRKCLGVSIFGIALWLVFKEPVAALVLNISVDVTGALPTLKKIKENPDSEDRTTWFLFWLGSVFNVIAINRWSIVIAMYPLLMLFLISLIAGMVLFLPREKIA